MVVQYLVCIQSESREQGLVPRVALLLLQVHFKSIRVKADAVSSPAS